jgi:hypothetical protein
MFQYFIVFLIFYAVADNSALIGGPFPKKVILSQPEACF